MDESTPKSETAGRGPSRLSETGPVTIAPFTRAQSITDASIYWIPVWDFPVLPFQRTWLREFHRRLAAQLRKAYGTRQECFLQFKSLYPDLLDTFSETSGQFLPMTGRGVVPGSTPAPAPDFKQVREQVEQATQSGEPVDTQRWMPDYLHWFLTKEPELQRDRFFGYGGMLTLFLPEDKQAQAPSLALPRVITSHPAYTHGTDKEIQAMYSLQDSFLQRSKQMFGESLRSDANFKGLLFVLPLLSGRLATAASAEERARWFNLFTGYFIESKEDKGLVLLISEPGYDEALSLIVQGMERDGYVYR